MSKSGNSYEDKTSDKFIRKAIKETIEILKKIPVKFQAVFDDGSTIDFYKYEEAMTFLSRNPEWKVFVK